MKTEKIIGGICSVGFFVILIVIGNKVGSSAGKQAAEERLLSENGKTQSTADQDETSAIPKMAPVSTKDKAARKNLGANMQHLGFAMSIFVINFDRYPNFELVDQLKVKGKRPELLDPKDLFSQLLASDALQSDMFFKTPSSAIGDWLYFGHALNSKSDETEIILISPMVGGMKGVLRLDNSVKLVTPEEAKQLTASMNTVAIRIQQHH